jgi:hypothetical protein
VSDAPSTLDAFSGPDASAGSDAYSGHDAFTPMVDAGRDAASADRCAGVDCAAFMNSCLSAACNPATGMCVTTPRPDGIACGPDRACALPPLQRRELRRHAAYRDVVRRRQRLHDGRDPQHDWHVHGWCVERVLRRRRVHLRRDGDELRRGLRDASDERVHHRQPEPRPLQRRANQ